MVNNKIEKSIKNGSLKSYDILPYIDKACAHFQIKKSVNENIHKSNHLTKFPHDGKENLKTLIYNRRSDVNFSFIYFQF